MVASIFCPHGLQQRTIRVIQTILTVFLNPLYAPYFSTLSTTVTFFEPSSKYQDAKVVRAFSDHLTVMCWVDVQQTLWQQYKTLQQTLRLLNPRF